MKQNVTVIVERASDGGFGCYMDDDDKLGFKFGLSGYGDSVEAAKKDFLSACDDMKELFLEEGNNFPEMEFSYKYDLQSFFNYFSFLNVSKIGEMAGINASLMRQYASGLTNAGEKQYDKVKKVVAQISHEMAEATF
jgi:hypothetical protein